MNNLLMILLNLVGSENDNLSLVLVDDDIVDSMEHSNDEEDENPDSSSSDAESGADLLDHGEVAGNSSGNFDVSFHAGLRELEASLVRVAIGKPCSA